MPSTLSRYARRYLRAICRSPARHRADLRLILSQAGITTPDSTYNVTDAIAINTARQVAQTMIAPQGELTP